MLKKIAVLSLIVLTSCRENETVKRSNEEPKALQEKSIDFGRFRKGNDLVEDLYQELVTKSPELKALENELSELNPRDTTDIFYNYDQKSNDYYRSADSYANVIRDSVMKQKILNLIKKSEEKYIFSLNEMERTDGEPDIVAYDKETNEYIFYDCAAESPKGRRSICYDHKALESRKEHKPLDSVLIWLSKWVSNF